MLSPVIDPAWPEPVAEPITPDLDLVDRPGLALAYLLTGGLMEICGPLFWSILGAGFLVAEFALD